MRYQRGVSTPGFKGKIEVKISGNLVTSTLKGSSPLLLLVVRVSASNRKEVEWEKKG